MLSDAYRFVIPAAVIAAFFYYLQWLWPALVFVLLAVFISYFFRNPARQIPDGHNLILSPADGKVVKVARLSDDAEMGGGQLISIFLNIFNVHANRSPIEGRLEKLEYRRGKFKAAFDEKASQVNEQNVLTIRGDGLQIIVKQIAGLIARRVVCWKTPGSAVKRGELIGLIRFGSRVDIIVPSHVSIRVKVGDKVVGGTSVLGEYA